MEERAQSPSELSDGSYRRRGRPSGKNRIPLSLNERRARNARYERERRYEASEAMSELADAAGCDSTLNNSDILLTVINQLQRAAEFDSSQDIEALKRCNEKLIRQVEFLEQRLSNWEDKQCIKNDDNKHDVGSKRKSNKAEQRENLMKPLAEGLIHNIKSESTRNYSDDHDTDEELQEVFYKRKRSLS